MVIEGGAKDVLALAFTLKRGGETVVLTDGTNSTPVQKLVFLCAVDCAESEDEPAGKAYIEIEGQTGEDGNNTVIPGVYVFPIDLQHAGGEGETQVMPGRYPFEVRVVTYEDAAAYQSGTEFYHQTVAYEDDNALVIHGGTEK